MKNYCVSLVPARTLFVCLAMGAIAGCSTSPVLHDAQKINEAYTVREQALSETLPDPWSMSRGEVLEEMVARFPNAKAHASFGEFVGSLKMDYMLPNKSDIKTLWESEFNKRSISYQTRSLEPSMIINASLTKEPPFNLQTLRENLEYLRSFDYLDDDRLAVSRFFAETIFGQDEPWVLDVIGTGVFKIRNRNGDDAGKDDS